MATIKFINSKGSLKRIIDYVTQEEKTDETLISGKDCISSNALLEMDMIKNLYNKQGGRTYLHIIQSFDPKDNLTHHQASEIGQKLSEKFKGFQILIATHKDRSHIHNHLIINTVSFENGKKLHQNKHDLQRIKDYSDKLCLENNLSIITEKTYTSDIKQAEYQQAIKGDSWKFKLMGDIDYAMQISRSKIEFISNMQNIGYDVNWTDSRKYITYTTAEGKKCRDIKLHEQKYLKENMENEFRRNETEKSKKYFASDESKDNRGNTDWDLYDFENDGWIEDTTSDKMRVQEGNSQSNSGEITFRTYNRDRASDNFIQTDNRRANSRIAGRQIHDNSERNGNRDTNRNNILDNSLLLAMALENNSQEKNHTYKSGDLSKQAKKEYAKKMESKAYDWEEEDEWER